MEYKDLENFVNKLQFPNMRKFYNILFAQFKEEIFENEFVKIKFSKKNELVIKLKKDFTYQNDIERLKSFSKIFNLWDYSDFFNVYVKSNDNSDWTGISGKFAFYVEKNILEQLKKLNPDLNMTDKEILNILNDMTKQKLKNFNLDIIKERSLKKIDAIKISELIGFCEEDKKIYIENNLYMTILFDFIDKRNINIDTNKKIKVIGDIIQGEEREKFIQEVNSKGMLYYQNILNKFVFIDLKVNEKLQKNSHKIIAASIEKIKSGNSNIYDVNIEQFNYVYKRKKGYEFISLIDKLEWKNTKEEINLFEKIKNYYENRDISYKRKSYQKHRNRLINSALSKAKHETLKDMSYINKIGETNFVMAVCEAEKIYCSDKKYGLVNDKIDENFLDEVIKKMVIVELFIFNSKFKDINIKDIIEEDICIEAIIKNGIRWTISHRYTDITVKKSLEGMIEFNPKNEYPMARKMIRQFTIHVGETNCGKTYESLQCLKKAKTGVYLAPLRLLALEVQENLNNSEVLCSLLTGEEEDIIKNATHMASTVEKLDITKQYDVCVIDEAQMVADSFRGFAWTRAILGVQSRNIHICTSPSGLDIICKMIDDCGDFYEIVEHKRETQLIFESKKFKFPNGIKEGDALIVFSKKSVLKIAAILKTEGIDASVIYGNLPYSVRKKQIERFIKKETKVVVSTDAIGMGLNLPIRRIVFLETTKFDGIRQRLLNSSEIKQVSGRAGRKGIYEQGYVNAAENKKAIEEKLFEEPSIIQKAYCGFSDSISKIDAPLINILKIWYRMSTPILYKKTDTDRYITLLTELKRYAKTRNVNIEKVNNKVLLKMVNIPFNEKNDKIMMLWCKYCTDYIKNDMNKDTKKTLEFQTINQYNDNLEYLETSYASLDLYYSFSKNFEYDFDNDLLKDLKEKISSRINKLLVDNIKNNLVRCKRCGKRLPWNSKYSICEECHINSYIYESWY